MIGSIPAIQASGRLSGRFSLLFIEPVRDFVGIQLRLFTFFSSAGVPGRVKALEPVGAPPAELDRLWGLLSEELGAISPRARFKATNDGGGERLAFKSSSTAKALFMW